MTMKYPTLRECIRKFLYFRKYSYGIVEFLKSENFKLKVSRRWCIVKKRKERTGTALPEKSTLRSLLTTTTHLSYTFSFLLFFFLIFFIANIVTRRIIGSHFKFSALYRFSLSLSPSLSFYLSIPCSLYTFFFSCILWYCFVHTHRYGCLVWSAVHVRLYTYA